MRLPLTIHLQASRHLVALLLLAHAGALALLPPLDVDPAIKLALAVAVAASAGLSLRRAWNGPVAALHLGSAGRLEIENRTGGRERASVLPQTAVLPGLIVLLLRTDQRRVCLVLLPDTADAGAQRQLRLWLKWHR